MHAITTVDTNRHIEKFYFPGKKIPRDSYFCDNDYLSNTKSVTVVAITQSYAKRYKYPPIRKSNFKIINEQRYSHRTRITNSVAGRFSAISHRKSLLHYYYHSFLQCYFLLHRTTMSFLSSSNLRWFQRRFEKETSSQHKTARTKTTSLISQESLDARIVHDFRFPVTLSTIHIGWKLRRPLHQLREHRQLAFLVAFLSSH